MSDIANTPTPTARKRAPTALFVDIDGKPTSMAEAVGIRIGDWRCLLPADGSAKLFALFGMAALALPLAKKWDTLELAPDSALDARFAKVTPESWGDEKPSRAKADPAAKKAAALDELVDVIRACKQAAGLAFDESSVRVKLSDATFARKVRKEPHVAAEIARRSGTSDKPDTLAGL